MLGSYRPKIEPLFSEGFTKNLGAKMTFVSCAYYMLANQKTTSVSCALLSENELDERNGPKSTSAFANFFSSEGTYYMP